MIPSGDMPHASASSRPSFANLSRRIVALFFAPGGRPPFLPFARRAAASASPDSLGLVPGVSSRIIPTRRESDSLQRRKRKESSSFLQKRTKKLLFLKRIYACIGRGSQKNKSFLFFFKKEIQNFCSLGTQLLRAAYIQIYKSFLVLFCKKELLSLRLPSFDAESPQCGLVSGLRPQFYLFDTGVDTR
jgi:hypothetical protein